MPIFIWMVLGWFIFLAIVGYIVIKVKGYHLDDVDMAVLMMLYSTSSVGLSLAIMGTIGLLTNSAIDWW